MTGVIFRTADPKSPDWRSAWKRFVARMLDPFHSDGEYEIIKEVHHQGWRAGVNSVRREQNMAPSCPRHHSRLERQAWEHGAVAGRQSARAYLHVSGKDPRKLK